MHCEALYPRSSARNKTKLGFLVHSPSPPPLLESERVKGEGGRERERREKNGGGNGQKGGSVEQVKEKTGEARRWSKEDEARHGSPRRAGRIGWTTSRIGKGQHKGINQCREGRKAAHQEGKEGKEERYAGRQKGNEEDAKEGLAHLLVTREAVSPFIVAMVIASRVHAVRPMTANRVET
jgi:hypothetical protein